MATQSRAFGVVSLVIKFALSLVGFAMTAVSVAALVGALTGNGWARWLGAVVITVVVPLVVADRVLPDDPKKADGLATDVIAFFYVATPLVLAIALSGLTRPLYVREGDRLTEAGWLSTANLAFLLGGAKADPNAPPDPVAPTDAPNDAGAPVEGDAGAALTDAGAARTDAGAAAADAGAADKKPEKTPAEIFKERAPSVVTIEIEGDHVRGGGTGFLIDTAGTIVTNAHVTNQAAKVRVKFYNGALYEDVDLLVEDTEADIALIRVELGAPLEGGKKPVSPPVDLGDSDKVIVGERAVAIGNPLGLEHTLSDGLVSSRRLYQNKQWIQITAPISPGNSGGPLFNMRSEVIGVVAMGSFGLSQNLNLAIPVNVLKKFIQPSYPARRKFGDKSKPSQW